MSMSFFSDQYRTGKKGHAALCLLLAGCASTVEVPKEVRVPVPVPCVRPEQLPERPQFMTDADILAFDSYRRTWALWLDRALRQAYEAQLEAVAKGCSTIPSLKVKS